MIQQKELCFLWDNTIQGKIPAYEKMEAAFSIPVDFENPYNPELVDFRAYLIKPSGEQKQLSGFWYEGYERTLRGGREILIPNRERNWRIRYAAREPGEYRYFVTLTDRESHVTYRCPERGELNFEVTPSLKKGFLRVSRQDSAYLEFSDGSPYLGIGHNLCGWEWGGSDNREGTYEYDRWLESLAQSGGNLAQFDFCEGDQLEWTPCENELPFSSGWEGLNHYNQQNAWSMDRRFQHAEELNIFFRLTLFHWEDFDNETEKFPDWGWNRNPYNTDNGGPAANVSEFFEKKACQKQVRLFLRYVAARWGYSPNLLAYELWNEIDAPEIMWRAGDSYAKEAHEVMLWHSEMGNYLKELDQTHLVTTSFANSEQDINIWQLPCIDLTTVHRYTHFNGDYDGRQYDTEGALSDIISKRFLEMEKPVLFGEFALSPGGDIQKNLDPEGIEFHNQLWSSLMLKSLGTAMHWTWGSYLYKNGLAREYRPLSRFFAGEDLRRLEGISNRAEPDGTLLYFGLRGNDRAYLWVKDRNHSFQAVNNGYQSEVPAGEKLMLAGLPDDEYAISFFDTVQGESLWETTALCREGMLVLRLPSFRRDVAVKVKLLSSRSRWKSIDFPDTQRGTATEFFGDRLLLSAGGAGLKAHRDECRFVYRRVSGDFELRTQIISMTNLGEYVAAGLMLRAGLRDTDDFLAVLCHPYQRGRVLYRRCGMLTVCKEFETGYAPVFRCTGRRSVISVEYLSQGEFVRLAEFTTQNQAAFYAGPAASSSNSITCILAEFDGVQLTLC